MTILETTQRERAASLAELRAAGLPAPASGQVVAGFETCFQDRASAKDPSAVPPSCQRAAAQGQGQGRVGQVVAATADAARRQDFSDAFQRTLLFEVAVFLLTLVLTFLLPDPRAQAPERAAPAGVAAGA